MKEALQVRVPVASAMVAWKSRLLSTNISGDGCSSTMVRLLCSVVWRSSVARRAAISAARGSMSLRNSRDCSKRYCPSGSNDVKESRASSRQLTVTKTPIASRSEPRLAWDWAASVRSVGSRCPGAMAPVAIPRRMR